MTDITSKLWEWDAKWLCNQPTNSPMRVAFTQLIAQVGSDRQNRDMNEQDLRWLVGSFALHDGVIPLPPRLKPLAIEILRNHDYGRFTAIGVYLEELLESADTSERHPGRHHGD